MFINEIIEQFPGYKIDYTKPLEKKEIRAFELKRLAEFGLLKFVIHPNQPTDWINIAVNELLNFDGKESNSSKGKHDDIVDSLSMAATYFKLNKRLYTGY